MTMESQIERSVGNFRGGFEWNFWTVGSEQGDSSSAEELDSPRSVVADARRSGGRWRRWRKAGDQIKESNRKSNDNNNKCYLHNQVLRIKEEELQIGEDFVGDYCTSDNFVINPHPLDDRVVIWSKAILPASPLGANKNNRND